jgi:hypothetical protein
MSKQQIDIRRWAYCRQTCIEIAQAIQTLANGDYDTMQRIWDAPTPEERKQVLQMAWGTAKPSLTTMFWGWGTEIERPTDGGK